MMHPCRHSMVVVRQGMFSLVGCNNKTAGFVSVKQITIVWLLVDPAQCVTMTKIAIKA